ncbi:rod shape-determining protein MreC [Porphyromonas sp.]|uniref:rod shape-determining protein MreC n=1 Tax=Porphyromonas sp. TaxID=1924944 RepID=UPI0026DAC61B|nr:rod shape-determining protein MreC [Porphyromonas sp.]MDO4695311.1 rod shape-determining protein MreC [Porphyromonas sp.]MDO4771026.1 rod shape-determining protein MreC [Porphyromonas sp.]
MFRLFELLKSRGHLVLFILLEVIAIILLYRNSNYHSSVILSSTNIITGKLTETATIANSYIGLKDANIELMNRNAQLEREVRMLRNKIERITVDSLSYQQIMQDSINYPFPYEYKIAKVVGNVLYGNSSYLTIDMGSNEGIYPDMGVLGISGLVGVVKTVGGRYAQVLPVTNKDFAMSCKVKDGEYIGILKWDGENAQETLLTNLPKHISYEVGDSVYTSSYSAIFPEGIFVGTIVGEGSSIDDNFCALKIRLNMGLENIKYVYVLTNYHRKERDDLETSLGINKK